MVSMTSTWRYFLSVSLLGEHELHLIQALLGVCRNILVQWLCVSPEYSTIVCSSVQLERHTAGPSLIVSGVLFHIEQLSGHQPGHY